MVRPDQFHLNCRIEPLAVSCGVANTAADDIALLQTTIVVSRRDAGLWDQVNPRR